MKRNRLFDKVLIIGVGLIGGSVGMAIRKKHLAKKVLGICRHRSSALNARRLGAIDKITEDLNKAVSQCDLIVIATPVCEIVPYAAKIKKFLRKGTIIIDVGSTKEYIVKNIEKILPDGVFYVGTHPMAGSQLRGANAASADLFKDSLCILTKTKDTDKNALKKVKDLWIRLGAHTIILKPQSHDRSIAFISHLPHIVAASLINCVEANDIRFAASGFKDATRIASSDPQIWRDICVTNRGFILEAISRFTSALGVLKKAIAYNKADAMLAIFKRAKEKRDKV